MKIKKTRGRTKAKRGYVCDAVRRVIHSRSAGPRKADLVGDLAQTQGNSSALKETVDTINASPLPTREQEHGEERPKTALTLPQRERADG